MAIPAIITAKSGKIKGAAKVPDTQLFLCAFTLGHNKLYQLPEASFTSLLYKDPKAQFLLWGEAQETLIFSPKQPYPLKSLGLEVKEVKGDTILDGPYFTCTFRGEVPEFLTEEHAIKIKLDSVKEGEEISIGGKVVTKHNGVINILHSPEKRPSPVAELYWKEDAHGQGILSVVPLENGVVLTGDTALIKEISRYIGELHLLSRYFGKDGVRAIALDMLQTIAHGRDINSVVSMDDEQLQAVLQRTAINRRKTVQKQLTGNAEDTLADRKILAGVKQRLPIDF